MKLLNTIQGYLAQGGGAFNLPQFIKVNGIDPNSMRASLTTLQGVVLVEGQSPTIQQKNGSQLFFNGYGFGLFFIHSGSSFKTGVLTLWCGDRPSDLNGVTYRLWDGYEEVTIQCSNIWYFKYN